MNRYECRINSIGNTKRERDIHSLIDFYSRRLPESLSYKAVKLNGEETHMIIDKGTQTYYKKFRSLHNQKVLCGDYVEWNNTTYIVYKTDADDEIYIDGMLYQCNYNLRWQNADGKIITRWTHIQNASSYNSGVEKSTAITYGSNQLMIILPIDEETDKLRRDRRVYCDLISQHSKYKFARIDSLAETFGEKGLLYIIATEDLTNDDTDNDELQICNYFEPFSSVSIPTDSNSIVSSIDYTYDYIRCGGEAKTFTAIFLDSDGNQVDNIIAEWEIDCDCKLSTEIDGNNIKISCSDINAIGNTFELKIMNKNMSSSIYIAIRAQY